MPTLTITSTSATTNANTKADGVYYRNGQHHNTAEAGNALTLTFTYNTDATQPTKVTIFLLQQALNGRMRSLSLHCVGGCTRP